MPKKNSILHSILYISKFDAFIFGLIAIHAMCDTISNVIPILLSATIIDQIIQGKEMLPVLTVAVIGVGITFLLKLLGGFLNKHIKIRQIKCYRMFNFEVAKKAVTVDFPQVENSKVYELKQRMKEDYNWGAGIFSVFESFTSVMTALFSLISNGIILMPFFQSKSMFQSKYAFLFLGTILFMSILGIVLGTKVFSKYIFKIMDQISQRTKLFYYFMLDGAFNYKSGKDVRMYNTRNLILDYMERNELSFMRKGYGKMARLSGLEELLKGVSNGIVIGFSYLLAALEQMAGNITIGNMVKYATCLHQVSQSFIQLVLSANQFFINAKRQESRLEFFQIPDVLEKGHDKVPNIESLDYEISFHNVTFRYSDSEKPVLDKVSFTIHKGDSIAIVGMNGSGKTTLIKLLCRLYDPEEGIITLNNVDIKTFEYEEYLSLLSVVFQDFQLFSFGIGENLAADFTYDTKRGEQCLADAGFAERYQRLEDGLETILYHDFEKDGVEVSGGEAQKIAIARALYKDAPIIILDEPTAALDPIAESEIYESFHNIVKNRTAIYISHRLSSCKFCKRIMVLEQGKIVQVGTHDELVQDEQGKYFELWNAQAQYYLL